MKPGTLTASSCNCGQISIPPNERCVHCSGTTELVEVTNTGRLLTYTKLHSVPDGFDKTLVLGIIELDAVLENKVQPRKRPKLVCQGSDPLAEFRIGENVCVKKDGDIYYFEKSGLNTN